MNAIDSDMNDDAELRKCLDLSRTPHERNVPRLRERPDAGGLAVVRAR